MTAAIAFVSAAVGAWAGGALVWLRNRSNRRHLQQWESDLRWRLFELERLFDIVADERKQLDRERGRGCGR